MEALIDVLMDNIFSYTPEGTAIAVGLVAQRDGGVVLTIDDSGPGFPDDADVASRGVSHGESTGLGLSIARRTAEASGGYLRLGRSSLGGARVTLLVGPPH